MGATVQAIPNANVQWQDSTGTAEIMVPNLRFSNWNPTNEPVGATRVALATGLTYVYVERYDYTCTFEMDAIPPPMMTLMQRLKVWLETGGQITVNTQDANLASYTVTIAPNGKMTWTWDPLNMWFTIKLAVKNTVASPMVCYYSTMVGAGYTLAVAPASITQAHTAGIVALVPTLEDPAGNTVTDVPVTYQSTNPSIAWVDLAGNVHSVRAGLCTINVMAGGLVTPVAVTLT